MYQLIENGKVIHESNNMEAANWWIMQHKLDHFEKAVKIKALV